MKLIKCILTLFLLLSACGCASSDASLSEASTQIPTTVEATSIEEQVLYESNEVKLVAKSLEVKDSTSVLTIHALNNVNSTLQIEIYMSSINGYAIDPSTSIINLNFLCDEDYRISFYNDELLNHNIGKITEFEFILNIFKLDDEFEIEEAYTTENIIIKTDAYGSYKSVYDTTGTLIYDENNMRIIAKDIVEGELILYVENNSDNKLSLVYKVIEEGVSGTSYVVNISNGKKAIRNLSVSSEELSQLQLYVGIEDLDHATLLDSKTLSFSEN